MSTGEKAEYRSSLRSKKLIRQAFFELIHEKELEKITVTDIVKRADINRRTFYAHYQDVRALIENIENETIDKLYEFLNQSHDTGFILDPLPQLIKVADYLETNVKFYRIIINSNAAESFVTKLKGVFVTFMKNDTDVPLVIKKTDEYSLFSNFIAGGIANILQIWFRGDTEQTLQELVTAMARLLKIPLPNGGMSEGFAEIPIPSDIDSIEK